MKVEAERIAIVKLGAIGDAVNVLPFLHRLRRGLPAAQITWVIGRAAHALLEGHHAVDRFLLFEKDRPMRWPAFVRELRRSRFELVIDLQRILKSAGIAWASGSSQRLGFDRARCKEGSWIATNLRIEPNPRPGVTVEQYLEFADFLELPRTEPEWNLPYTPYPSAAAGETRIVVNVGASKSANRWYVEKWARLCTRLVEDAGARVYLSGGREDRETADALLALLSVPVEDQVGVLSLKESAGLIAGADVFIGCDTGPLHIAAAVGTPCVALFGAADPRRTGPYGAAHEIVSHAVPCSPCRRRECNVAGHPCMSALEPDLVYAHVRRRLSAARSARAAT